MSLISIISALSSTSPYSVISLAGRQLINDTFSGTSLSGWSVANPGSQTVTVNNSVRVQGGTSTKDASLIITNSGYGYSTLRNYGDEVLFKLNSLSGKGLFVGVKSDRPVTSAYCSSFVVIDLENSLLQIVGAEDDGSFSVMASIALAVTLNTSDDFILRVSRNEGVLTAYLVNATHPQYYQILTHTYSLTVGLWIPLASNIFHYGLGVIGSSDVTFKRFTTKTTELATVKGLFLGDSITLGSFGGDFEHGYAELLRDATTDRWQIMAGGGNKTDDIYNNLSEILAITAQYATLRIGTNDGDSLGVISSVQAIYDALVGNGTTVYLLTTPGGGNPATAGTYNHAIKAINPSTFIDDWTTGWNTMTTGNGDSADGTHPTAQGHLKLKGIIKAALPSLFPL